MFGSDRREPPARRETPEVLLALAGGVGGAKLAHGLSRILRPEDLAIVVNVGDDFEHLGLHVSPDIDTVVYTLAGIANPETGWGVAGETWSFMDALGALGGETWFRLGDRDLATHVERTRLLAKGASLSEVTRQLARKLGVAAPITPASDDCVRTVVATDEGELEFQHYFVRRQCAPRVLRLCYRNADMARPTLVGGKPWTEMEIAGAVICPSNPYLSIAPILAMPAVRAWLENRRFPVAAVSPIVAGRALKGPAAKIIAELGTEPSALAVARFYAGLVDFFVIDTSDAALAGAIRAVGMEPVVMDSVMTSLADRERLAREICALPAFSESRQ
jgi:LPPG:FO 2-phospho-L-lactate transferase